MRYAKNYVLDIEKDTPHTFSDALLFKRNERSNHLDAEHLYKHTDNKRHIQCKLYKEVLQA